MLPSHLAPLSELGLLLSHVSSGVTFWASYVFFNAIFPKLSHDLPEAREAHAKLLNRVIDEEEYERRCSLVRSKVMNHSCKYPFPSGLGLCLKSCIFLGLYLHSNT